MVLAVVLLQGPNIQAVMAPDDTSCCCSPLLLLWRVLPVCNQGGATGTAGCVLGATGEAAGVVMVAGRATRQACMCASAWVGGWVGGQVGG